jgi:cystathionine beta-lyase
MIQTPVYYPFFNAITTNNRELIENRLQYQWDNHLGSYHYYIDFGDLESKIKEKEVKLFILCSPHNPVGRIWTLEELKRIGDICRKYNVILVADEVHCDLTLPWCKTNFVPFYNVSEDSKNFTVAINSASKTFNLAGLKCCSAIISNPDLKKLYDEESARCGQFNADIFGLVAMEAAYTQGEYWLTSLRSYLQENLDFLVEFYKQNLPLVRLCIPEATYLVWCDFSFMGLESDKIKQLFVKEASTAIDDGKKFGDTKFMRINIGCPRIVLREALSRILTTVAEYLSETVHIQSPGVSPASNVVHSNPTNYEVISTGNHSFMTQQQN